MISRILGGLCGVLLIGCILGWGLWWYRGSAIKRAKLDLRICHENLAVSEANYADAQKMLDEQTQKISDLSAKTAELQDILDRNKRRVEELATAFEDRGAELKEEAAALKERLEKTENGEIGCRESLMWLVGVERYHNIASGGRER